MPIELLAPSSEPGALPVQHWLAMELPVPPTWRVEADLVRSRPVEELTGLLAGLGESGERRYWVMQQGPVNSGSLRQNLVNLDTDAALAAALRQFFQHPDAPGETLIQSLPAREAAGVLFTRHPMRPDLDHIVVEGVVEAGDRAHERLILQRSGELAFASEGAAPLVEIGTEHFLALARHLSADFDAPQACEWIWDGRQLWMLQTLPVGSLPRPEDVWTRRSGMGIWTQAVSPLWYTLEGRWLKVEFWRRLGKRLGWRELDNIEPYRRLHSHIYTNARFFRQLARVTGDGALEKGVPPAWRETPAPGHRQAHLRAPWRRFWHSWRLRQLEKTVTGWKAPRAGAGIEECWHALIRLDRLGERLARVEGWLAYVALPQPDSGPPEPLDRLLTGEEITVLRRAGRGDPVDCGAAAADPAMARFRERPPELKALEALSPERRERLAGLPERRADGGSLTELRARARWMRYRLGDCLRRLLLAMSGDLVSAGLLTREDDVFFLYFDELWQLWNGQGGAVNRQRMAQRKMRYMNDAHQGAPDWVMDQVGYGINLEGRSHPVLAGQCLVPGEVSGPVRRLHSGWELSLIRPGDVIVVDECDTGWLPWLGLAGALVLGHRNPRDPAAALAKALGIPAVWGVDDAMHCLPDEAGVDIDAGAGRVKVLHEPGSR